MQQRISILGCGWLGLPLAENFVQQGYQVMGSTTTPEKLALLAEKNIKPFLFDLNELEITPENQEFFQSEILVINVPPKRNSGNPYAMQMQNLASVLKNTSVKRIIFVSSTSVYSSAFTEITEASSLDETAAKELIRAENAISSKENPWLTTIIRFAGLFGPGREPGRFLAGKVNLPDPEAPVNVIHLQDCIHIISEIVMQEKWGEVFNACADEHPSRQEFYTEAARKLNLPEPAFELPKAEQAPVKLISSRKLKDSLNYEFKFPSPLAAL